MFTSIDISPVKIKIFNIKYGLAILSLLNRSADKIHIYYPSLMMMNRLSKSPQSFMPRLIPRWKVVHTLSFFSKNFQRMIPRRFFRMNGCWMSSIKVSICKVKTRIYFKYLKWSLLVNMLTSLSFFSIFVFPPW